MESALDQRIDQILARRREEQAAVGPAGDHPDRERRLAHDRVAAELQRLEARITDAVAEINDRISAADIWVRFEIGGASPAAEAVYTLDVGGRPRAGPTLSINVAYTGKLTALLGTGEARTPVLSSDVFEVGRDELEELLVSLLEAQYR